MKRQTTFVLVLSGAFVLGAACTSPPHSPVLPRTSSIPTPHSTSTTPHEKVVETNPPEAPKAAEPIPIPTLEQRLAERAVTEEHIARAELYSWTTRDQVAQLRQTQMLLVATAKTRGAPSPYSRLLLRLARRDGPTRDMAKLLSEHPGLTKRRYAWPNPFATAVPLGERSYGHALVHIVLKDEALVVKLDPLAPEPFSFVDLKDKPVPMVEALAHPERIGAIFHLRLKTDGGPRFREYIVCNEAMIARWSVGTAHERAAVAADSELVAALLPSDLLTMLGKDEPLDAPAAWSRALDKPGLLDAWRASLAFDSPKYKPSKRTLEAIAASLASYDPGDEPLEVKPSIEFPDKP